MWVAVAQTALAVAQADVVAQVVRRPDFLPAAALVDLAVAAGYLLDPTVVLTAVAVRTVAAAAQFEVLQYLKQLSVDVGPDSLKPTVSLQDPNSHLLCWDSKQTELMM